MITLFIFRSQLYVFVGERTNSEEMGSAKLGGGGMGVVSVLKIPNSAASRHLDFFPMSIRGLIWD